MKCEWCKTNEAKKRFCSHPCRNAWTAERNKLPRTDEWRRKQRLAHLGNKPSHATRSKMSKSRKDYISKNPDSFDKFRKATESKYLSKVRGTGWKYARILALERDDYTCQNCGVKTKPLLVHHKDYKGRNLKSKKDMNNDLGNLITWCYKCHNAFHRHKSKDYKERMSRIQA